VSEGVTNGGKRAVFLDRDGVLNVYLPGDYVRTPDQLHLLPGAAEAVRRCKGAGLPVFVISNQQGVAKGLMTDADLVAVDAELHRAVAAEGGHIERSYYCTHASADSCDCRKPQPGLLRCAAAENGISLADSVFIGDTETDAAAAHAAGVGTFILVLTGKHREASVAADAAFFPMPPHYVAADLLAAVEWYLGKGF
jgi:D-glycero-D-manno-heptose 1,7-bisphosphate phosphatase